MVEPLAKYDCENLDSDTKPLFLSQLLGGLLLATDVSEDQISNVKSQALELADVDSEQFDQLFDDMVSEWKGYESLFNYDAIAFNSIEELEARAKESMIQISLGMETEIQRIEEEKKELEESALIDVLTTLKNRAAYECEVPGVVDYHCRSKKSFGVIVIDIGSLQVDQ